MNKIIYFDKETIQNILQERNKGTLNKSVAVSTSSEIETEINVATKIDLGVPFWDRLRFLFSGNMSMSYIVNRTSKTTISSTEISEFKKIKNNLIEETNIKVLDIENSSTFFRVAAGYLKMMKGGIEGVDVKEFKSVMDSYDGYDTYKITDDKYVRFNNKAFVSNYKRNDLLTTKMNIFCIPVGAFAKDDFDFQKQILKMEKLITNSQPQQTLADLFPDEEKSGDNENIVVTESAETTVIKLYDVVYSCIEVGDNNA